MHLWESFVRKITKLLKIVDIYIVMYIIKIVGTYIVIIFSWTYFNK